MSILSSDTQPPPHECQWCGRDLTMGPHKPTCSFVTEVDDLEIPAFLRRKKETKE